MKLQKKSIHLIFSRRVITACVFAFFVIAGSLYATRVFAADTTLSQDERLVTIHDGSSEVTIVTRAATVKDALSQASIAVSPVDIVEPAASEQLVAKSYQVNIFRARPVVVVDGRKSVRIMTAEQSPRQIAKAASMTLHDEDLTEVQRVDDVLSGGGAGLKLTIDRATVFSLTLYGKTFEARTQATTVAGLLKEKGVTLGENDGVRPALDTPITTDLSVSIWRNGKQTVTVEEAIVKPTEEIKDPALDLGVRQVKTTGADGKRNVTYQIEMIDGIEVARQEIASVTTLEPVKEVVVVGAKINLVVNYSADKAAIMSAAGVAPKDQGYAAYIIDRENALWCPIRWQGTKGCGTAYYEKFEGAESSNQVGYGLCQSPPAIKMASAGADWRTNAVTQMKWCHSYAMGRYGSWEAAYLFKVAKGWW